MNKWIKNTFDQLPCFKWDHENLNQCKVENFSRFCSYHRVITWSDFSPSPSLLSPA